MQGVTTDHLVLGFLGFIFLAGICMKLMQPRDSFRPEPGQARRSAIGFREGWVIAGALCAIGGALYVFRSAITPQPQARATNDAAVALSQSTTTSAPVQTAMATVAPTPTPAATATPRPTVTPWPTVTPEVREASETATATAVPAATETVQAPAPLAAITRALGRGEVFATTRVALDVRESPAPNARVVGTVPADARVILIGRLRQLTWVKLEHPDATGWALLSGIAPDGQINRVRVVSAP